MAADPAGDNPRHVYGPRPIGALLPAVTRPAFRKRSPAAAQLLADWPAIVGPALAAVTAPRKFSGGTLAIACSGPIALELQHLSAEVMARINAHLGRVTVERLRFVQESVSGFRLVPVQVASPRAIGRAVALVQGLPEGALRDALVALGSAVLTQA